MWATATILYAETETECETGPGSLQLEEQNLPPSGSLLGASNLSSTGLEPGTHTDLACRPTGSTYKPEEAVPWLGPQLLHRRGRRRADATTHTVFCMFDYTHEDL